MTFLHNHLPFNNALPAALFAVISLIPGRLNRLICCLPQSSNERAIIQNRHSLQMESWSNNNSETIIFQELTLSNCIVMSLHTRHIQLESPHHNDIIKKSPADDSIKNVSSNGSKIRAKEWIKKENSSITYWIMCIQNDSNHANGGENVFPKLFSQQKVIAGIVNTFRVSVIYGTTDSAQFHQLCRVLCSS